MTAADVPPVAGAGATPWASCCGAGCWGGFLELEAVVVAVVVLQILVLAMQPA